MNIGIEKFWFSIAALEQLSADEIKYDGTKEVIEFFFLSAPQKVKEEFFYNKGEEVKKILQGIEIPEIQEAKEKIKKGGLIKIWDEEKEESLLYLYKNSLYEFRANYTDEEKELLILELEDKERQAFERLKRKFLLTEEIEREPKRKPIPEEIRIAVWRRDSGQCAKCSSRKNLEYDHIIPVSKGGSNTVRNSELLCEECNRKKRDNII